MIPKIIHQIWFGEKPMPASIMQTWRKMNPDWNYMLWTEKNLPRLYNQELFEYLKSLAMKSDVARYELLYRYGGVYVDADMICMRSLNELPSGISAFLPADHYWNKYYCNGIMGSVANHPYIMALIKECRTLVIKNRNAHGYHVTGPALLTRLLIPEYKEQVYLFEKDRKFLTAPGKETPDTFAIHYSEHLLKTEKK
jgi:inositol phosphorylceramide mannosyltransferase catalytic subunit